MLGQRWFSMVAIALFALAACGGQSAPSSPTAAPPASSSQAAASTAPASSAPSAAASAVPKPAASSPAAAKPSAAAAAGITMTPLWLSPTVHGVFYQPSSPEARKPIALFVMHESDDFTNHFTCRGLASRGFQVLCVVGRFLHAQSGVIWDQVALDVKSGMEYLRKQPDLKKVFILGHSGGGALSAYYQNVAENGISVCQDAHRITPCGNDLAGLPKADGIILIDPIPGLAFSDLTYWDPSVTAEDQFGRIDPSKIDPSLDMFSKANGYDDKKPTYSADFVKRFYAAQGARNNRLIDLAQSRMQAIKAGKGWFPDNEPFIVSHAASRLWVIDLDLASHTQQPHTILTASGSKQDIARSVRTLGTSVRGDITKANLPYGNGFNSDGALKATVKSFLSTFAIRTTPDYGVTADTITGVDWQSANASTISNLSTIKSPLLMLSATGHYWLVTTEMGYNVAPSSDKTLAFVEGASHGFSTCKPCETTPGQFGDTEKTTLDYLGQWLDKHAT
jgi:pimeloyl-ACP methyl ester carboxylesterase